MQSYTLILRNAHGRLVRRLEFGCVGDDEARRVARQEAKGRAAELWTRDRQIESWPVSGQRTSQVVIAQELRDRLPTPEGAAVIVTSAAGLVSYWDRNAAALYGWSAREALGRNIVELTPAAQSRTEAAEIMRTLQAGLPWEGEIVLKRKDGSVFHAFVLDVPVEGSDGSGGIVGVSLPADRREDIRRARPAIVAELARCFSGRDADDAA